MHDEQQPPAPAGSALRFLIERRTLPADAGFSCEYWVREMVWAEPSESDRANGLFGAGFPGDVWARVVVSHRGELEIHQAVEPWLIPSVAVLSDLGSTFLECRDRASHDITNWAGPRTLIAPT